MRITNSAIRQAVWDRNAGDNTSGYNNTAIAPHASTVRATYVIPAGRYALIEFFNYSIYRATAAGAAGKITVQLDTLGIILYGARMFNSNVVGADASNEHTLNHIGTTGQT